EPRCASARFGLNETHSPLSRRPPGNQRGRISAAWSAAARATRSKLIEGRCISTAARAGALAHETAQRGLRRGLGTVIPDMADAFDIDVEEAPAPIDSA